MRPKKRVLLYCADTPAGEQMAWLLAVRSNLLRMTTVSSPEAFVQAASAEGATYDCVIVYRSKLGGETLVARQVGADRTVFELLRVAKCGGVVVEVMNGQPLLGASCAHKIVSGKMPTGMADVVNAVVMACARKRGPRSVLDVRRGFSLPVAADRMVA